MEDGEWFRLLKGNDWGADYVSRSPYRRARCTTTTKNGYTGPGFYRTADRGRAYKIAPGERIDVRLQAFAYVRIDPSAGDPQQAAFYVDITPNQLETFGPAIKGVHVRNGLVIERTSTHSVSDHGKSYSVRSSLPAVRFDDGTEVSLLDADIRYEAARDPTHGELPTEDEWDAIEQALLAGDERLRMAKEQALAKLTTEERKLLGL